MPVRVLVVGYRAGICRVLEKRGVEYAIWDEKLQKKPAKARHLLTAPLPKDRDKIKEQASRLLPHGPFTHIIAGTESSVFPASVARRVLGARKSKDTLILSCHDKLQMKRILQQHHIPMTDFLHRTSRADPQEIIAKLGIPVVIKNRDWSGGRGIVFGNDARTIEREVNRNKIIEKFVDAPEVSVESFISGKQIRFANITQYYRRKHINIVPAILSEETIAAILALNKSVIQCLKISWGITHLEMYLTENGPIFGEIALRPPGGYIMELITLAYGFDAWQAFVAMELDESFVFNDRASAVSAVIVLHPGKGRVLQICGREVVQQHRHVKELQLKVSSGDEIGNRLGVGEDVGKVILLADTSEELLSAIHFVEENLIITMHPEIAG